MVVRFFQCLGNPAEQAGLDLATVDLVQHLVSTVRIKIESDIAQPGLAVAANQCVDTPQLLPDGVFASGEQIDREIAADLAERDRIVQPRRRAEEGNKRVGVKVFKAEGISHERIDDRLIAAQPVERRARRLECGVEEVAARGLRKRGPGQAFKRTRSREDQTINLVAVVDDVSLRGKGSHIVPQQQQRQVGIFLSGDLAQADYVLDEKFKAAAAKLSQL